MILKKIQVKTGQIGLLTNCYIICDESTKEAMVIDPGGEPEKIIKILNILRSKIKIYISYSLSCRSYWCYK